MDSKCSSLCIVGQQRTLLLWIIGTKLDDKFGKILSSKGNFKKRSQIKAAETEQ